ncbi:cytochrome C [Rhodospirillaceae bacterium KN72]|uniref:Cytochrome C n=1 Tax=Pacificispira spongiicola TaxID=2729598 RepID=A0A7Y0HHU8_9PROT|nr:cytochrome C [Pacificispira spongiicola]NMM46267.1 cytochrome C [Pacificispira spongiicola]
MLFFLITLVSARLDGRAETPFDPCRSCHEIGPGAKNRVGPHLDGILGRQAGSVDGFAYSKAMLKAGEDGLTWTAETLSEYVSKPRDFVPGNRMSFRGMVDAEDRAALIDWLRENSGAKPADDVTAVSPAPTVSSDMASIVLQTEGDPAYGEYLSTECVTCHQASGHADGIPSIVGLPRDYFIRALLAYQSNIRDNEVMKLITSSMGNEEMAALAAYFGSLSPN